MQGVMIGASVPLVLKHFACIFTPFEDSTAFGRIARSEVGVNGFQAKSLILAQIERWRRG